MDNYFNFIEKHRLLTYGVNNLSMGVYNNGQNVFNQKSNELYDIASLTKVFTLNLVYNLYRSGALSLEDNIDKYLGTNFNITILDILKMNYYIKVRKNLRDCETYDEFKDILLTGEIIGKYPNYNDFGFCMLGLIIEKITNRSLKENFEDLFESLNLYNTKINPVDFVLLGNGNDDRLPNDLKTRVAGGITGAAGIFSTVKDLLTYLEKVVNYEVFDEKFVKQIFEYNFIDSIGRNRTFAGLHKFSNNKHSFVKSKTNALAQQGYTGCWLSFDFDTKTAAVLLTNSIDKESRIKNDNFFVLFKDVISNLSKAMYI